MIAEGSGTADTDSEPADMRFDVSQMSPSASSGRFNDSKPVPLIAFASRISNTSPAEGWKPSSNMTSSKPPLRIATPLTSSRS